MADRFGIEHLAEIFLFHYDRLRLRELRGYLFGCRFSCRSSADRAISLSRLRPGARRPILRRGNSRRSDPLRHLYRR